MVPFFPKSMSTVDKIDHLKYIALIPLTRVIELFQNLDRWVVGTSIKIEFRLHYQILCAFVQFVRAGGLTQVA